MADFSFLSDSDDEKAAKLILEQASDSIVLESIAALNCSAFTDSILPSNLESRFHKLKSFPSVSSKPNPITRNHSTVPSDFKSSTCNAAADDDGDALELGKNPFEKTGDDSKSGKIPIGEKGFDFDSSLEDDFFWDSIPKRGEKPKPRIERTISLPSGYSSESLSPPKKSGCFWCSPKRVSRNKSENRRDLNSYLDKKEQRLMKKAMEEEDKLCREAEKLVKLAKHASARIEISDIDDELTDTENLK